jgi:hypothetical protein
MWLPTEIELLSRHYPDKGFRWIAERLSRTADSVTSQARRLGLRARSRRPRATNTGNVTAEGTPKDPNAKAVEGESSLCRIG